MPQNTVNLTVVITLVSIICIKYILRYFIRNTSSNSGPAYDHRLLPPEPSDHCHAYEQFLTKLIEEKHGNLDTQGKVQLKMLINNTVSLTLLTQRNGNGFFYEKDLVNLLNVIKNCDEFLEATSKFNEEFTEQKIEVSLTQHGSLNIANKLHISPQRLTQICRRRNITFWTRNEGEDKDKDEELLKEANNDDIRLRFERQRKEAIEILRAKLGVDVESSLDDYEIGGTTLFRDLEPDQRDRLIQVYKSRCEPDAFGKTPELVHLATDFAVQALSESFSDFCTNFEFAFIMFHRMQREYERSIKADCACAHAGLQGNVKRQIEEDNLKIFLKLNGFQDIIKPADAYWKLIVQFCCCGDDRESMNREVVESFKGQFEEMVSEAARLKHDGDPWFADDRVAAYHIQKHAVKGKSGEYIQKILNTLTDPSSGSIAYFQEGSENLKGVHYSAISDKFNMMVIFLEENDGSKLILTGLKKAIPKKQISLHSKPDM